MSKPKKPETLCQDHARNLDTLKRAFSRDEVALVECKRTSDGTIVAMLCAVHVDDEGQYTITPFAEMVNGNPYDLYLPPNPNGGF